MHVYREISIDALAKPPKKTVLSELALSHGKKGTETH